MWHGQRYHSLAAERFLARLREVAGEMNGGPSKAKHRAGRASDGQAEPDA